MKEIRSEKNRLIPLREVDWENYFTHVTGDGEVYLQYGMEPSDELIEAIRQPTKNVLYYSVISAKKNEMAGYVGVTPENGNLEFYIFKECRRKGHGEEAIAAFSKAYLDGEITGKREKVIVAETMYDNDPASALLEKLGFVKQATVLRFGSEDMSAVLGLTRYELTAGKKERKKD